MKRHKRQAEMMRAVMAHIAEVKRLRTEEIDAARAEARANIVEWEKYCKWGIVRSTAKIGSWKSEPSRRYSPAAIAAYRAAEMELLELGQGWAKYPNFRGDVCHLLWDEWTGEVPSVRGGFPFDGLMEMAGYEPDGRKNPAACKRWEIRDMSYPTHRFGVVAMFRGCDFFTDATGRTRFAVGHGPKGSPEWVTDHGYIAVSP